MMNILYFQNTYICEVYLNFIKLGDTHAYCVPYKISKNSVIVKQLPMLHVQQNKLGLVSWASSRKFVCHSHEAMVGEFHHNIVQYDFVSYVYFHWRFIRDHRVGLSIMRRRIWCLRRLIH